MLYGPEAICREDDHFAEPVVLLYDNYRDNHSAPITKFAEVSENFGLRKDYWQCICCPYPYSQTGHQFGWRPEIVVPFAPRADFETRKSDFGIQREDLEIPQRLALESAENRCHTPLTMYQATHGTLAEDILCKRVKIEPAVTRPPPCNVCEDISPLCRDYRKFCLDPCYCQKKVSEKEDYWKPYLNHRKTVWTSKLRNFLS